MSYLEIAREVEAQLARGKNGKRGNHNRGSGARAEIERRLGHTLTEDSWQRLQRVLLVFPGEVEVIE